MRLSTTDRGPAGPSSNVASDAQAFAAVVETYQVPVFNLCFRMVGDLDLAEEAAQETFLRAFRSLSSYDSRRPMRTWLLSIAAHHCIDLVRRRSLLSFVPLAGHEGAATDPTPEASLLRREANDEVKRLLSGLRPAERAVVVLTYWYDLPQEEIAATVGLSVGAVRTRLYRARRQLAEAAASIRLAMGREGRQDEAPAV